MKPRPIILLLLCIAFIPMSFAQDVFDAAAEREEEEEAIPQVRMQMHFIELTDKAISDLGLTKAFRKHVLPKGTIKDWQKLEAASKSFRSIDVVVQSGQEAFTSAVLEAAMPESFEQGEITISKDLRIEVPPHPVMGVSRDDLGITLTVTPQVDEKGRIMLELHPKLVRLLGMTTDHKATTANRTLAEHPMPVFRTREVRTETTLNDGETLVKAISYRGGKVKTGHYCLMTVSRVALPDVKPVVLPEDATPRVGITLERVRVPAKHVKAFERALGDAAKLQDLYDKGMGDVLVRMTTLCSSGTEVFSADIKEQAFAEAHEESEIYLPTDTEGKKEPTNAIQFSPATPVFGETQLDLGSTLTVTPQVAEDGRTIYLDMHPRQVALVGAVKYPGNTQIMSKVDGRETIKADLTKPIFEADEVRTQVNLRHGIPMVVTRNAHKSSPRIRTGKCVTITDKAFADLEKSAEITYVYTIIRADILEGKGAKKK